MRPDTRSFSFTWLKGQQQSTTNLNPENRNSTSMSVTALASVAENVDKENNQKGPKEIKMKRIGSSFLKGFETNYSSMENEVPEEEEDADCEEKNLSNSGSSSSRSRSNAMSIGKRLNKTVQDVKTSLGNLSQRFRRSTRRRYRMGPATPGNEISPTRRILGRTPTKLYSPFGFDSPLGKPSKRRSERLSTPRLERQRTVGFSYSPSNTFNQDVKDAQMGLEDFQIISRDITRRSVRF